MAGGGIHRTAPWSIFPPAGLSPLWNYWFISPLRVPGEFPGRLSRCWSPGILLEGNPGRTKVGVMILPDKDPATKVTIACAPEKQAEYLRHQQPFLPNKISS